jgi:hypothetical protein
MGPGDGLDDQVAPPSSDCDTVPPAHATSSSGLVGFTPASEYSEFGGGAGNAIGKNTRP